MVDLALAGLLASDILDFTDKTLAALGSSDLVDFALVGLLSFAEALDFSDCALATLFSSSSSAVEGGVTLIIDLREPPVLAVVPDLADIALAALSDTFSPSASSLVDKSGTALQFELSDLAEMTLELLFSTFLSLPPDLRELFDLWLNVALEALTSSAAPSSVLDTEALHSSLEIVVISRLLLFEIFDTYDPLSSSSWAAFGVASFGDLPFDLLEALLLFPDVTLTFEPPQFRHKDVADCLELADNPLTTLMTSSASSVVSLVDLIELALDFEVEARSLASTPDVE